MKKIGNVLWGLVIIALGVVIATNELGITDIDLFFDGWWTLFIIVPCFIGLFSESDKAGNIFGIILGLALFLGCQGVLKFAMIGKLILPLILVIIGFSIMFRETVNKKIKDEIKKVNEKNSNNSKTDYSAIFSKQDVKLGEEQFEGSNLNAIFGGAECDFSKISIANDVVINVTAIFGGVEIYLPQNVNVKIKQTAVFGGIENNRKQDINGEGATIYINATCVFGGVEIK